MYFLEGRDVPIQLEVKDPEIVSWANVNEEDNIQDPMSFSSIAEQTEKKEHKEKTCNLKTPILILKGK